MERCRQLAQELGVEARVHFLGWYESHGDMLTALRNYRGALLPSLEDANGILVQEAMAVGLPMICLDWGGPQLLVEDGVTGYLIKPVSKDYITTKMAECLDRLSTDGHLADGMSLASRRKGESWRWSQVARSWLELYGYASNASSGGKSASSSHFRTANPPPTSPPPGRAASPAPRARPNVI